MLRLEGTSRGHLLQPLSSSRIFWSWCPRTMSRWLLNNSREEESTVRVTSARAQGPSQSRSLALTLVENHVFHKTPVFQCFHKISDFINSLVLSEYFNSFCKTTVKFRRFLSQYYLPQFFPIPPQI